ncbi:Protein translocase membrane subunit SecG [Candidatus Syntrophocurvum alkaliphilum]|uniref:Protein-export membrane protein SecG n=1 Tax=Candidatus Syntrophocurvum alkaliphilum TaxID=2293317 RepID=A0A6I6DCM5_9FIRM|nr:preprotein translocase subunit SecG [Candidatus Syntrophocurvum alkaliphilum]QGU00352.1 Protein translocase membrane subunit SecG [Candidatus Syntrophocurvum alkaliphilum]
MLYTLALVLQFLLAVGLITTILLQSGKSAGLSGSIAGGGEAIFGKSKGVDTLLAKITAYIATLFMLVTLAIGLLS